MGVRSALKAVTLSGGELFVALINGMLSCVLATMFGALVFSGAMEPYLNSGVQLILLGSAILIFCLALTTPLPSIIGGVQDTFAITTAIIVAATAASLQAHHPHASLLPNAIAAISLTTLTSALLFLLTGYYRLGKFVRFIPYPVLAGFLAGAGWLIFCGAFTTARVDLDFFHPESLFSMPQLMRWLPALVYATLAYILLERWIDIKYFPWFILGGIVLFYTTLWMIGMPIAEARAAGYLMPSLSRPEALPLTDKDFWSSLRPGVLFSQAPLFLAAAFINLLALLMRAGCLELVINRSIDIDREISAAGWSNLPVALVGGVGGFLNLSMSTLNYKLGISRRIVGVFTAGMCFGVWYAGGALVGFIPNALCSALFFYIALNFLYQWGIHSRKQLSRVEWLLVLLIVFVIATKGLLVGVFVGIMVSMLLFTVQYSLASSVKARLQGDLFLSSSMRGSQERQLLAAHGSQILVLKLQGYLFFGNSEPLAAEALGCLRTGVRYIVLDFSGVLGADSTAAMCFVKLIQHAKTQSAHVVITAMGKNVQRAMKPVFLEFGVADDYHAFHALEQGHEWCENALLSDHSQGGQPRSLKSILNHLLLKEQDALALHSYLVQRTAEAREVIFRQGHPSEDMLILETGEVEICLELPGNAIERICILKAGSVIGEMGFYLGEPRSATAIAYQGPVILQSLSHEAFQRMQAERPELVAALHRGLIRILAKRVAHTNELLQKLLRG